MSNTEQERTSATFAFKGVVVPLQGSNRLKVLFEGSVLDSASLNITPEEIKTLGIDIQVGDVISGHCSLKPIVLGEKLTVDDVTEIEHPSVQRIPSLA